MMSEHGCHTATQIFRRRGSQSRKKATWFPPRHYLRVSVPTPHLPFHSSPNLTPQYTPRYSFLIRLHKHYEKIYSSLTSRSGFGLVSIQHHSSQEDTSTPQKNPSLMDGTSFWGREF